MALAHSDQSFPTTPIYTVIDVYHYIRNLECDLNLAIFLLMFVNFKISLNIDQRSFPLCLNEFFLVVSIGTSFFLPKTPL